MVAMVAGGLNQQCPQLDVCETELAEVRKKAELNTEERRKMLAELGTLDELQLKLERLSAVNAVCEDV